jgi:hypothetical protein
MVNSMLQPGLSLPDALAARARAASDVRLGMDVVGGVVAAAAIMVWRPAAWLVPFSAAVCFAAFGLWGIADRKKREHAGEGQNTVVRALRFARVVTAVVGAAAAVTLIFGALAIALGTFTS